MKISRFAQLSGSISQERIGIKENIRAVKTHVIHPAEPLDTLTHVGAHLGQKQLAEAVMGITCGHGYHLGFSNHCLFYTKITEKNSVFPKKFLI